MSDKEYVVKVKDIIQSVSSQYLDNVESGNFQCKSGIDESLFFEVLMMEIRGATISYSTYRKKVRNNTEEKLIQEIKYIESNSTVDINTLDEKKSALEKLRKEKLLGHMVRSRAQWLEEGEKPSKYFCNLESRNYLNKTIKKIEAEDIGTLHEQGEILDYVKKYYEKLYASVDTNLVKIDLDNIISNYNSPKLEKELSNGLEEAFLEKEVLNVIKHMKNNKSPGSDGYTAEFFKFFWKDIKNFVVRAINCIFLRKELPISQRLGIISCLPKGDKPRQFLKNWRPITLLNVLYKIISGCVSFRIRKVLDYLISDTQSGFIKGRYIGENTRFIFDLLSYTEFKNIPGLLVLIDFEKAFDSMSWSFIYQVLKYFGFGEILFSGLRFSIQTSMLLFYSAAIYHNSLLYKGDVGKETLLLHIYSSCVQKS